MRHLRERLAGRAERSLRAARFALVRRRRAQRDALFVSGPGGDARRYRCEHAAEALRLAGRTADVGYRDELDLATLVGRYRAVVLYRVAWDDGVERALDAARAAGTTVLADVDDLVFDPEKVELMRWVEPAQLGPQREAAALLRRTLEAADGIVVSTEPLARHAATVNADVVVVPNVVSRAMVRAGAAAASRRRDRDEVVVAYLSGTATHDRDFLEAADAVEWALDRYDRVRFWAVGHLALDASFDRFGHRVVRIPYRPARDLPRLLAGVDVNLAPLELGNEFTEAKSCLKYLEAAVAGVPTIASPTSDFARAIEHGGNGLLAADTAEWRDALEELVGSRGRRRGVGAAARQGVREHHSTMAAAARYGWALEVLAAGT